VNLVLASRSPQRSAILTALGVPFAVRPSGFEEIEQGDPVEVAVANALGKARAVARASGEVVLGVDTVVALGGRLHGKPAGPEQARATLAALSGATHTVVSGVALLDGEAEATASCATSVRFRSLDEATIEWYLATGEWHERAGAYAIQGAGCALVESIEGDHANVIGLPVGTLLALAPALLDRCNNHFAGADYGQLQP
jgi:septum formation protein